MRTKIIGHRGVAGLELENSKASLLRAVKLGVDYIEFDVRITKDGHLVLNHYASLVTKDAKKNWLNYAIYKLIHTFKFLDESRLVYKLAPGKKNFIRIKFANLDELKNERLVDGSKILTLDEALKITKDLPLIIETKDYHTAELINEAIKKYQKRDIRVASFKIQELAAMRRLNEKVFLYALEHIKLLDVVAEAKRYKLNGVGMNYWLLNPLTYRLARRKGLEIYVYTFNLRFLTRIMLYLYPDVSICSDHPEWFLDLKKSSKADRVHA